MNNNPVSVQDEVILVTGAFGLIGKQISKAFLQNGAKVVLADINSSLENDVHRELQNISDENNFLIIHLDITNETSAAAAIEATALSVLFHLSRIGTCLAMP